VRQGLRLEYAMGAALSATNVSDVQITNCTISNSGTDGIIIDGRESTVSVSLRLISLFSCYEWEEPEDESHGSPELRARAADSLTNDCVDRARTSTTSAATRSRCPAATSPRSPLATCASTTTASTGEHGRLSSFSPGCVFTMMAPHGAVSQLCAGDPHALRRRVVVRLRRHRLRQRDLRRPL